MKRRPVILISSNSHSRGAEFDDASTSLSHRYPRAVAAAGGVPLVLPLGGSDRNVVAEAMRACDGLLLTGGEDVETSLYAPKASVAIRAKAHRPDRERDWVELQLIDQAFGQRKSLFGICRGHQIVNVALGGTLLVDIATQRPGGTNHDRFDRKNDLVHDARLTEGSLLSKIMKRSRLDVNSSHHQAVDRVARPLRATAVSSDGIIEGLELKDGRMLPFFLTVQFHPERLVDRYKEFLNLFKFFVRSCTLTASN